MLGCCAGRWLQSSSFLRQQLQRHSVDFQLQRAAVALQQLDLVVRAVVFAMLQFNLQHLPLKAGCQTGQDVLNALNAIAGNRMVGRLRQQLARGRTHDQPRAGGVAGVDMDLVHALPGAVAVKFDIADVLPRRQLELCQIRGQRGHGHCLGMVLAAVLDGAATGGIHQQALLVALGIQQFDFIAQFVERAALAGNVQHPATVVRAVTWLRMADSGWYCPLATPVRTASCSCAAPWARSAAKGSSTSQARRERQWGRGHPAYCPSLS